jgi:hypothetical protein
LPAQEYPMFQVMLQYWYVSRMERAAYSIVDTVVLHDLRGGTFKSSPYRSTLQGCWSYSSPQPDFAEHISGSSFHVSPSS